jgi:hydrogenase maturation protease
VDVKIFAVGNPLYGDDGIGKAVLDRIGESDLFPGAQLIDVGTDALALIDHFADDEFHVIIDAAKMGEAPGSVVSFTPDQARLKITWDHLSLHGFGLAETFNMARGIGRLPARLKVVGVEPESINIDEGLSAEVTAAIPRVVDIIRAEVQNDG